MSNFGRPRPSHAGPVSERDHDHTGRGTPTTTNLFWTTSTQALRHAPTALVAVAVALATTTIRINNTDRAVPALVPHLPRCAVVGVMRSVVIETPLVSPVRNGFESTLVMFQSCARCRGIRVTRTGPTQQQTWRKDDWKTLVPAWLGVVDRQMHCGCWKIRFLAKKRGPKPRTGVVVPERPPRLWEAGLYKMSCSSFPSCSSFSSASPCPLSTTTTSSSTSASSSPSG